MFGAYRTFLACMVIAHHLGGILILGPYAVFGFFVLSGYLMTLVLHEKYGYTRQGLMRYAINRFLRIYPSYFFALILSVLIIAVIGDPRAMAFEPALFMPTSLTAWLENLLLLIGTSTRPVLTLSAWALSIELFFYLCIGLGLSRTTAVTVLWFCLSLVHTLLMIHAGALFEPRYFTIPAASLPFSIGALTFHFRHKIPAALTSTATTVALFLLLAINFVLAVRLHETQNNGFYINLVIVWLLLCSFAGKKSLPFISRQLDAQIGAFSYPFYLTHIQCGLIVAQLAPGVTKARPFFALLSMPLILAVSWLMIRYIDKPIGSLREKV